MTNTSTRTAMVTGASRGIGSAVAKRLARDGFAIAVNYAGSAAKAEEVVAEIKAAGGQAIAIQADVANATDVERLFKQTIDTYGGIDVVVNNAGIMLLSPIGKGDLASFDKVIATNLRGTQAAFWPKPSRLVVPTLPPRRVLKDLSTCLPMSCVAAISP